MLLSFLGSGCVRNLEDGTNSAFFIRDREMHLLDAGFTVLYKIKKLDLFKNIESLVIHLTHTHEDHISNLASIITHFYYTCGKRKANICSPEESKITAYLDITGIGKDKYEFNKESRVEFKMIKTPHDNDIINYARLFKVNGYYYYYSGDSPNIPYSILIMMNKGIIKELYQDLRTQKIYSHMSIDELFECVEYKYLNRVYAMHFTSKEDKILIANMGIKVVNNLKFYKR